MGYKNIKHSILFSFLSWVGNVQSGHIQEAAGQEAVPEVQAAVLTPPFDFLITFSGSFGEIRSNHFHGGLDFKTGGVISKPVHALIGGHISHIRVTHGSGYVLDVNYGNGYSTINHHFNAFTDDVTRKVKELQYGKESWEVGIVPKPGEYPVKAGQVIALSGSTGYSFDLHLHLGMIESVIGDYINPLPFSMEKVKNNTAPRAEGIILPPQPSKGVVSGKQTCQTFPAGPVEPITAWGSVGVGIRTYDYMDGVDNRYGVHTVVLEMDGMEVFRSVVDRFAYGENRYTGSWTHRQCMKSFVEPGNRLHILHTSGGDRELVEISEEHPYRLVYALNDALGSTSRVRFTIQGKNTAIRPVGHREKYVFKQDKTDYLQGPGLELVVPRGMLCDDVWLNYSICADSGGVAFTYQLNDTHIPMYGACEVHINLCCNDLEGKSKCYVASVTTESGKYSVSGVYEGDFMRVRIRGLATYAVVVDTVPPETIPLNPQQWRCTGRIAFGAKDKGAGINSYRGTIDGKYALFGKPNSISDNLACKFNPEHVKKGGRHTVEMTVTDGCGNQIVEQFRFA